MSTIVLRSVKGTPLTNQEVDDNFNNLNTDKLQLGGTYSSGTANGVAYLNGSKVLTTGSALTFNGTNLTSPSIRIGGNLGLSSLFEVYSPNYGALAAFRSVPGDGVNPYLLISSSASGITFEENGSSYGSFMWKTNGSEQMRLTSTGLGIGTSSPATKLHVASATNGATLRLQCEDGGDFVGDVQNAIEFYNNDASSGTQRLTASIKTINTDATYGRFGRLAFFTASGTTTEAERMTLDSSGSLGLGVTPSAWGGIKAFEFGTGTANGSLYSFNNDTTLSANVYYSSGLKYISTSQATRYQQSSGAHYWFTAPSGTAGNAISFTQAMTLNASGRLSIGTTGTVFSGLTVQAQTSTGGGVGIINDVTLNYGRLDFLSASSGGYTRIKGDGRATGFIAFETNDTERARIDSSGNLLVGTTTGYSNTQGFYFGAGAVSYTSIGHTTAAVSGDLYARFVYNGTGIGSITQNGTTGVSYNTSSDYRLKEDIQPMTGALAKVAALKPCTYKWKADGSDGEGFIAHELAEVVPGCVTGEKDAVDAEGNPVYQGIDTSFLVATLTAAIQEQQAIITAQAAQIQQLREKVLEVEEGTSNMLVENTNNLYETITALTARVAALESN